METVQGQERQLALLPCPSEPTEEQQWLLRWLGSQFGVVWNHRSPDARLKKRIMRCLIREIIVDVSYEDGLIQGLIHWQGGAHTELRLPRRRTGQHRYTTDQQVIELIRSLARVCPDGSMASILNRLGFTTGRGNGWTESRVRSARGYHGIPNFDPDEKVRSGWLTMAEAAQALGVSPMSVRRLLQEGTLCGEQLVPYAPWVILRRDLLEKSVQREVRHIRGESGPPRHWGPGPANH